MAGNGGDFAFYRGASTQAWPKPRRGEATKRGGKIAPPARVARKRQADVVENARCSLGYTLRFSPHHRTVCVPFPTMGIFKMGSIHVTADAR